MTAITINAKNRTIELTKTFATASSKFGTPEYDQLQLARKDYPNYKVVTIARKAPKNDKPTFKGLTYEYMEKYILTHDDDKHTIMNEYLALRGESEAEENLETSFSYQEMKDWFLDKFSAFNEYHTKHAELIKNAQKAKEAKRAESAKAKRDARRVALLAKKTA
ncbi:MAG: hypothetical protein PUD63_01220 [Clostridia bacterium]|nr:hypothetical protein [Clostridia bacterium]